MLNPSRKSHRRAFFKELENQVNLSNIKEMLVNPSLSCKEIEKIDESITKALSAATREIEGPRRNAPCSAEKVKSQEILMF